MTVKAVTSWIALPATDTLRASGRSRAPLHSAQGTSPRSVSSRCRFDSLAVVAYSFSSRASTPGKSPPSPWSNCSSDAGFKFASGVFQRQLFAASHVRKLFFSFRSAAAGASFHGTIAPPAKERSKSGRINSGSNVTREPRPSQAGQAP